MALKKHNVSGNTLKFFGGTSLMLVSIIMIINIGYVAKAISFPFYYFFGIVSYLIFIYLFAAGISLFIRKKYLHLKWKSYIAIFFIILGLISLLSTIYALSQQNPVLLTLKEGNNNWFTYTSHIFNSIGEGKGYIVTPNFVDCFVAHPFAGGFLGNLFTAMLFDSVGIVLTFVIESVVIFIGLCIYLIPFIVRKIKNKPQAKEKDNKKESVVIANYDVISTANIIPPREEVKVDSGISIEPAPVHRASQDQDMNEICRFLVEEEPAIEVDDNNKFFMDDTKEEEDIPASNPQEEIKYEQTQLDFEAEQQPINLLLAQKQPEFVEPKVINKTPSNPTPENRPIDHKEEEKPKPKIKWIAPSLDLLNEYDKNDNDFENNQVAQERKALINQTFEVLGIRAECVSYLIGPSFTRYEIEYEGGELVKNIESKVSEISIALNGVPILFNKIVPGTKHSSFEIANAKVNMVSFKEVIKLLNEQNAKPFEIGFGLDITGSLVKAEFLKFPHLLLAGTTNSGKSVFLNSIFMTLIMRNSPDEFRMAIVDPKVVDTMVFKDMPHLLCPIINKASEAKVLLQKLYAEMEDRYLKMAAEGFNNISDYNQYMKENNRPVLPVILVALDEFNDLVQQCKEISQLVTSIVQKARAAAIHVIVATQRPSNDVITGTIKGNLSTRVALMVAQVQDSVVIIGEKGAEDLLGNGDMLVQSPLLSRTGCRRCQGCYVNPIEIKRVTSYLKDKYPVDYNPKFLDLTENVREASPMGMMMKSPSGGDFDAKYESIKEWVMTQKYVSMSKIQRSCGVGFNRAGMIFDKLKEEGIIEPDPYTASTGNRVIANVDEYSDDYENN